MRELISTLGASNVGLGAILSLVVLLLMTGGLIPAQVHKRALKDKDDQIAEWRETHATDTELAKEQAHQISRLLDASRTTTHLIQSMETEVIRRGQYPDNEIALRDRDDYGDDGADDTADYSNRPVRRAPPSTSPRQPLRRRQTVGEADED